jgi:hypothetical protein
MIIIMPLDGTPADHFEDFNELFDRIIATETAKLTAKNHTLQHMDWSFTIHPPKQVAAFYNYVNDPSGAIKEAFDDGLPLIEICIGDYKKPTYIPLTPNVNMDYLKRKWCVDWCTWHHLLVREV